MSKELFLVDGSGFIFRAYHALPPLSRADGTPVGAVMGFCNMLSKLIATHRDAHIAVIFDAARKNFRNDIYELKIDFVWDIKNHTHKNLLRPQKR